MEKTFGIILIICIFIVSWAMLSCAFLISGMALWLAILMPPSCGLFSLALLKATELLTRLFG